MSARLDFDQLLAATNEICQECAAGDGADCHPSWGWFHGQIGVEVRPCRAWKFYQQMAALCDEEAVPLAP